LTLFCLIWVALALDKGEVLLDKCEVVFNNQMKTFQCM